MLKEYKKMLYEREEEIMIWIIGITVFISHPSFSSKSGEHFRLTIGRGWRGVEPSTNLNPVKVKLSQ